MIKTMGTGVFIFRYNYLTMKYNLLLGKRAQQCSRAPGIWALPGGMLENDETVTQCAIREVREETCLDINVPSDGELQTGVIGVVDHLPRENHITAFVLAERLQYGEPVVMEPTKCELWQWVETEWVFDNIPQTGEQQYWTNQAVWQKILPSVFWNK